ncbi:MAG TPA: glycosyltransferase, partial [Gemmatimonadaceae bacterium]|nr:glycosyltransferase [Gemmatimonadaceae bacterium]
MGDDSDRLTTIEADDLARLSPDELRSYIRKQASELAAARAENELNRKSKALRIAQIASESRSDVRLLPRAALRLAGVLVPARAQARVRATLETGRELLHRARQVTRTNTRWPDDRPLISVVIPCFNYGAYVEAAIDSVLNQTWKDLEIIVVDGGSTDGTTVDRLRALDKPMTTVHFRSGRHLVGDNRNFGIGLARGKYICCLDADDILAPTYLEKAVFLAEAYAYDLVFPSVRCFGEKNDLWMVTDPTVESCRVANGVSTVGLFRRQAWEKIGGYRDWGLGAEHVPEDWDFWLRLLGHGFRAKSIREPLMYYRVHGHGLTGTATMDVKAQAAKIEEANQLLRTLRLRITVALVQKAKYVVENPTVNLCRVPNT